jgi:NitT/TauT family transport system permease protein
MGRKIKTLIPVFLFFAVWETVARLPSVPHYLFPPFSKVIIKLLEEIAKGDLIKNTFITLYRVGIGFFAGTITGIVLGLASGISEKLNETISPIVALLYPIPSIGWIPVLMVWFGISDAVPIIAIFICSFFPIYMNAVRGVKSVDSNVINAARTMGANKLTLIKNVILPLSMPNIFTGLKIESGMSLRTGVVAEMLAIPSGLGYMLMKGESLIDVKLMFAVLLSIALISVIIDFGVKFLEKKVLIWQDSASK